MASARDRYTEILSGAKLGLGYACVAAFLGVLGVIAATLLHLVPFRGASAVLLTVLAWYVLAGLLGGVVYALLRPLRHRYIGQYLTAVLVLLAIYAGGALMMWPFLSSGDPAPPPRAGVVAASAVLCLAVAPLYVRRWRAGRK